MRLEIHKTSFFNFLTWIYTSLKVVLLKKVHCNLPKVWFFKVKLENFQICCQFCSPFALVFLFSSWWQWSAMTHDWPNLCLVIQCGNVKRNIQENAWKVKYHGWLSDTLERTFPFEILWEHVFLILGHKVHVVSPFVAMVDRNTIEFKNCKNGGLSKSKKFAAERVWKMCRFRWKTEKNRLPVQAL